MSGVVGANGDPKVDQNRKEVMDLIDQHRCISETGKALAPSDLAAGVPRISKIRELCLECTATSDSFKVLVWSQPHDDLIDAWTIDEKKHVEHLTKQAKDIH